MIRFSEAGHGAVLLRAKVALGLGRRAGAVVCAGPVTHGVLEIDMSRFDFEFLSMALGVVGLFFICCSTVKKKPKHILEEAFGIYQGRLRDLKSSVFKRNQVIMGFLCVLLAVILHIGAATVSSEAGFFATFGVLARVAAMIFLITAFCGILNYLCRLWSKASFRRLVGEVVTEYDWPLEQNMVLTQEIGKILGVPADAADTVESYVRRLRLHLDLPPRKPGRA